MKTGSCVALDGLRRSVMFLGIGLLITACGGGSDQMAGAPEQEAMPGDGTGSLMTQLGEWNVPMPGGLDVSDANNVLRAYYDSSGGHVVAGAPVQPEGAGTATWTGMWSGEIDVDPAGATALSLLGATASGFQELSGGAVVTVYFIDTGDEVDLTYQDLGLDDFGLSELTSERVLLSGGTFRPTVTRTIQIPSGLTDISVTGTFAGEGAFGGANAEGVAGYVDGDISASAPGLGTVDLGTFKSVFYGDKDSN
ncbi:MAG: hypothetical protein OXI73_08655 [Rhodospirillales bacterium]|nr:hypothetical protein [Rhodospirillales bacterium]